MFTPIDLFSNLLSKGKRTKIQLINWQYDLDYEVSCVVTPPNCYFEVYSY